ncbi:MAG: M23 family metallopeptidase [Patescibacteria group bacterium]|nr:M23 family metallopeptidase [Patescibacteria group bacterium]
MALSTKLMNKKNFKILALIFLVTLIILFIYYWPTNKINTTNSGNQTKNLNINSKDSNINSVPVKIDTPSSTPKIISQPINNALSRVTLKPFGIKVSQNNSPVNPERFSGYHTGVDFETLNEEQDVDIKIYAICTGLVITKKHTSGYGGVIVQECQINNSDVTVVYGHLRLSSVDVKLSEIISSGQAIGVLGKGYSPETDGERKHLHLGIHRGKNINLLGYTQNQNELAQWLDITTLLK